VQQKRNITAIMRDLTGQLGVSEFSETSAQGALELSTALEELSAAQEELLSARSEAETQRARYQELFEFAPDGYLLTGPRGRIEEVNQAATELFNVPAFYLLSKPLAVFVHGTDRPLLAAALARMKTANREEWTLKLSPRNSASRIAQVTAGAVRRWGGELEAIRWIVRDVTEQSHAQNALRASRERIRLMASKLALTEERERRRIATEIHDHISQSLAVAKLRLGMLRSSLLPDQLQGVDEVRDLLSQVIVQTRSLTFELSPTVLYELGLGAAIEWLIEQRSNYGVQFKFHNDAPNIYLKHDLAVTLFQAIRELVMNVVKHARATQASVKMMRSGQALVIEVEDNGIGFHVPEQLKRRVGEASLGLFSVQERLDHLGGKTDIDSTPGGGTRVRLTAPLQIRKSSPKRKGRHET
jgi:PAS domain S-box-containing protein